MTITKTEVIDVRFSETEKGCGLIERKRLIKLGYTYQGADTVNGQTHLQFIRINDVTPTKYD